MQISALCPIVRDDDAELLYFADAETGDVYALDFHKENAVLIGGAYTQRFIGRDDQVTKRGVRIVVKGVGLEVSATLRVTMDGGRVFSQPLTGPYDTLEGLLFYQEFDPTQITFKVAVVELSDISGVGVEITDWRFEYTEIDGG